MMPSYPQMADWIGAHGDQLRHEAERRGVSDLDSLLTLMLDDVFEIYVDETDDEIAETREYTDETEQPPTVQPRPELLQVIGRQEAEARGLGIAANGGVDGFQAAHGIPEPITEDVEDQFRGRLAVLLGVPRDQLVNNGNFYYLDRVRHLFYSPTSAGGWVVDGPPTNPGVQAFVERTRQGWSLPAQPLPPTRGPWATR